MTQQTEGRRTYIIGNTFAVKDQIKAAGGHWDADRRAWWVSKAEVAQRIVASVANAPQAANAPREGSGNGGEVYDGEVKGKASYKGKSYYIRWSGATSRGTVAFRLVSLDGKLNFWADADAVTIEKRYEGREFRGNVSYPTLASIRQFIADRKANKPLPDRGGNGCYMCGRYNCDGAKGGLCEDD